MVTTALLVDGTAENKNLELSSRNLEGVELVKGSEVHPYHLLRYDRAIFSRPALEKLQESLKASAPEASGGGGVMKSPYQIIRKPVITEKGLAVKEREGTLVFQVATERHQDGNQASRAGHLQSEG